MNRIIQLLTKLFSNGAKLRNGRKILPNPTKLNRITQFEKLIKNGKIKKKLEVNFSEKQQIRLLNQVQTGKLTPQQAVQQINRKNYDNFFNKYQQLVRSHEGYTDTWDKSTIWSGYDKQISGHEYVHTANQMPLYSKLNDKQFLDAVRELKNKYGYGNDPNLAKLGYDRVQQHVSDAEKVKQPYGYGSNKKPKKVTKTDKENAAWIKSYLRPNL
jgi:hypothetical protein